jgi:tetratricopeptide (TPR) repeat protein
MGDFRQAESMYRRALLAHPDPQVLNNLVYLLMQEDRLQEALALAMDYAERHDGPEGHIHMAEVYFDRGSREQGLQIMEVARDRAVSNGQLVRIARVFFNAGMPDNALELLSVLQDERARLALAELYRSTGHVDRAAGVLEHLRRRTADTVVHYRATLELASLKPPAASLELYSELMADFPHRFQAYHNAALVLMEQGEFEEAVSTVQRCMTTCTDLNPSNLSDLYVTLGAAQYHHGNHAEATRFFRQAGRLNPKSDLPVINLNVLERIATERDKRL